MRQLEKHEKFTYLIADPFNRSYNCAKLTSTTENAQQYKTAFRTAFMKLKQGEAYFN